ncbi:MAG: hypothetical protein NC191_07970 [Muribaculaceae bacterium]|nr:hypothetical protein [Muribaculaceae bacterium]
MKNIQDELNRLSYEVWELYQLMRILTFVIEDNNEIQDIDDTLLYPLALAKIIKDRLEPMSKELDLLLLKYTK